MEGEGSPNSSDDDETLDLYISQRVAKSPPSVCSQLQPKAQTASTLTPMAQRGSSAETPLGMTSTRHSRSLSYIDNGGTVIEGTGAAARRHERAMILAQNPQHIGIIKLNHVKKSLEAFEKEVFSEVIFRAHVVFRVRINVWQPCTVLYRGGQLWVGITTYKCFKCFCLLSHSFITLLTHIHTLTPTFFQLYIACEIAEQTQQQVELINRRIDGVQVGGCEIRSKVFSSL